MSDAISNSEGNGVSRPWIRVGAIAIVIATIITYIPALNSGFIWDDDDYVTNNALLLDMDGLKHIWLPSRSISRWIAPQTHAAVLPGGLYDFLAGAQGVGERGGRLPPRQRAAAHRRGADALAGAELIGIPGGEAAAGIVAALFALHPVHVESVAWVTERKNVLSGLLYLSAAWAFLSL